MVFLLRFVMGSRHSGTLARALKRTHGSSERKPQRSSNDSPFLLDGSAGKTCCKSKSRISLVFLDKLCAYLNWRFTRIDPGSRVFLQIAAHLQQVRPYISPRFHPERVFGDPIKRAS